MSQFFRLIVFFTISISLSSQVAAQLQLNEICHGNLNLITDADGDYEDWFEITNVGSEPINLEGYGFSDNADEPLQWTFAAGSLAPGEHLIVWASGKNRNATLDHYEVPAFPWDEWNYFSPTSNIGDAWKSPGFNDNAWASGPGGIGYGDGDDGTEVEPTISVYVRRTFELEEVGNVVHAFFLMDYDDAYVAYLNGVEIARGNIGEPGSPVEWNQAANGEREAQVYAGGDFELTFLDTPQIQELLVEGENVLAIQVHNTNEGSSDLSCIPLLIFGKSDSEVEFPLAPEEFGLQVNNQYHTNFKLSTGETLFFYNEDGVLFDSFPITQTGVDESIMRNGDTWCFTSTPTPGAANAGSCAGAYEPKPLVSQGAGVYTNTVNVTVTPQSNTSIIRYTLDGSIPNASSPVYVAPLQIDVTSVLSVRAFSTIGNLPSQVEKNTYLINEPGIGTKFISISTNDENLWDENIGIYVLGPPDYEPWYPFFGSNIWEDWERKSYIEFFDGEELQFEGEMGLAIHGGWSRAQDQKSFRIRFRDEYGLSEAQYPLIPNKPEITRFKNFNLRNAGNDAFGGRMRDAFMQRVVKDTYNDHMGASTAVLFLNGEYWGHYEIREVMDENWCETNRGKDADMIDLATDTYMGFDVKEGSDASFWEMHNQILNADPTSAEFYELANENLDLQNFADYIITETYYANCDWSCGYTNNTKFWHYQGENGKWRYMLMDLDFGLGLYGEDPNVDFIIRARDEDFAMDRICNRLLQNTQFRNYFINRYADLINTVWQQPNMVEVGNEIRDEIAEVIERHHLRWGGDYDSWYNGLEAMLAWNEQRIPGARNQVQNHFGLNGQIDITLDVQPSGAGRIHISTIEPDEAQYPWTGVYYRGIPIRISAIANPGYTFQYFEANGVFDENMTVGSFVLSLLNSESFVAHFTGAPSNVVPEVAEFMYHSDASINSGDWIEMVNPSNQFSLNVSSWSIQDNEHFNRFVIPVQTIIPPSGRVVIAEDRSRFEAAYPEVNNVIGSMGFALSNNSDQINIFDTDNQLRFSFTYSDEQPWPLGVDGHGRSVEREVGVNDPNAPSSWFAGCEWGSPGTAYQICDSTLLINEINYRSNLTLNAGDWWELKNTSSSDINLGGYIIRDEEELNTYTIPAGTVIESGGHLVFVSDAELFESRFPAVENLIETEGLSFGNNDVIRLYDNAGLLVKSTAYSSSFPWPQEANGNGKTMELLSSAGRMNTPQNWFAGCLEGSPGEDYDPACGEVSVNDMRGSETEWTFGPNPASQQIQITGLSENSRLEVIDGMGKIVISQYFSTANGFVDVSNLSSGIYVIRAASGTQSSTKVLVVN